MYVYNEVVQGSEKEKRKVQRARNKIGQLGGDHVKGHLDVQAQETKITNVSPSTVHALVGVSRGVTIRVGKSTSAPDQSKDGGGDWVAGTGEHERNHEGGVTLEGVLVDTLFAVKDHLLLVLLGLGLFGVHGRQGDAGLLAVSSNFVAEDGDKDSRDYRDGDGLMVFIGC